MEKPRPGPTALLITVRPAPGKYAAACCRRPLRVNSQGNVVGAQGEAQKHGFQHRGIPLCRRPPGYSTPDHWQQELEHNSPRLNDQPRHTTAPRPKSARFARRRPTLTLKYTTKVGVISLCILYRCIHHAKTSVFKISLLRCIIFRSFVIRFLPI